MFFDIARQPFTSTCNLIYHFNIMRSRHTPSSWGGKQRRGNPYCPTQLSSILKGVSFSPHGRQQRDISSDSSVSFSTTASSTDRRGPKSVRSKHQGERVSFSPHHRYPSMASITIDQVMHWPCALWHGRLDLWLTQFFWTALGDSTTQWVGLGSPQQTNANAHCASTGCLSFQ